MCGCRGKSGGTDAFIRQESDGSFCKTPSDITLTLPVCEIQMKAHAVSCAVQKDSGDDPDITNKILIFAEVSYIHNNSNMNKSTDMTVKKCDTESERSDTAAVKPQIIVDGGVGIGRITKKDWRARSGRRRLIRCR